MGRAIAGNGVGYVIFYVTAYCNLLCKHCFYTEQIKTARLRQELTTDEYFQISEKLGPLTNVNFTGGEPFLRKDLGAIVKHMAAVNRPSFFGITTNGLLKDRIVRTLADVLPACKHSYVKLGISLDGIQPQHDYIRDLPGAYAKAIGTVRALEPLRKQHRNFFVYISTTLTKTNNGAIEQLIDEVATLPVDAHYLGFIRGEVLDPNEAVVSVDAYRRASAYLESKWSTRKDVFVFLNTLNSVIRKVNAKIIEKDEFIFPCVAGRQMLTFSEDGYVMPCEILDQGRSGDYRIGNIRDFDYDVNKVLQSDKARELARWIVSSKCHCTFECANQASIAYSPVSFLKALAAVARA